MTANYIAIDWGSSHLRAWRIENGACVAQQQTAQGVKFVEPGSHDAVLMALLAPWRAWIEEKQIPVLMAGMIGSDSGWLDSGYQSLPLPVAAIAAGCIAVPSSLRSPVWLRPGLALQEPGRANVMRGEEVQLLGALTCLQADIYLFPGTHSKWVKPRIQADGLLIEDFSTAITGELYQVLLQHSLLGKGLPADEEDPQAFADGVQASLRGEDSLLNRLFYARSRRVLGYLPAASVASWLSGVLIGEELAQLARRWPQSETLALVGDAPLVTHYLAACRMAGQKAEVIEAQVAMLNGFGRIYAAL
ncbi:2-dehydro-3-deoxygalactonokinase [Pseudomonas lundensis]|uniref:2-dehydro-3-deoxygalactonokinase n=1 Tax=Serratia proteamaculans TaxID=28151 RepID=UPI002982A817|nr:2-dehydro-3-deoxygalactonokinase [Serratia proteamaculans]MDW5502399.1 2-dehydro-3-deoxygalactonokinase [Serratia proteamaculans]MDW5507456.1 2-dehydro-3-deoxygalactonokinase [Pseudomonas lundensis]